MRIKIALRNLYISQTIIFLFLIFAYFVWFPYSFSELGGFFDTAIMLVLVDFVLGPLLVFIVFREGKKYLTFDINVLLSIQIFAFLFGAYSLYLKHPAYAVLHDNQFVLTNVSYVVPKLSWQAQLKKAFSYPELVVTTLSPDEKTAIMIGIEVFGSPAIERRTELFKPLTENKGLLLAHSIPVEQLLSTSQGQEKISQFLEKNGGDIHDYAFLPLTGNNKKNMIWAFDRKTTTPIAIIKLNPKNTTQLASK